MNNAMKEDGSSSESIEKRRGRIIEFPASTQTQGIEQKDIVITSSTLNPDKTDIMVPAGYRLKMVIEKIESEYRQSNNMTFDQIHNNDNIGNITGNLETKPSYDMICRKKDEEGVWMTKSVSHTFINESLFLAFSLFLILFGIFNILMFSVLGNYIVSPYISFTLILMGMGWGTSIGYGLYKIWRKSKS